MSRNGFYGGIFNIPKNYREIYVHAYQVNFNFS